jgi:hypothetical protein
MYNTYQTSIGRIMAYNFLFAFLFAAVLEIARYQPGCALAIIVIAVLMVPARSHLRLAFSNSAPHAGVARLLGRKTDGGDATDLESLTGSSSSRSL